MVSILCLLTNLRHPDRHQRPTFANIVDEFGVPDDRLLVNGSNVETICGNLGDAVDRAVGSYADLQNAYKGTAVVQ